MQHFTEKLFITPNDSGVIGETDSCSIQNAIACAKEQGINKILIPRYNKRTDSFIWIIEKTILLPSDITVILDDCHLRLADGVFCNMFINSKCYLDEGKTALGEERNIVISGIGSPVLDGGKYNGLSELNTMKNGMPEIYLNTMIFMHNVRDFKFENFSIINHRWWGMTNMFARQGRISNIHFEADISAMDSEGNRLDGVTVVEYDEHYVRNTDGIDLRVGCNNIIIENITGVTGDDTIALTALLGREFEMKMLVENRDTDIHSVIIKNVQSDAVTCANVRLLNQDGNRIYNILIDGIIDSSGEGSSHRGNSVIRIGESNFDYISKREINLGELSSITIRNIVSRARCAVALNSKIMNCYMNNLQIYDDGLSAITCEDGCQLENVLIDGIMFAPHMDDNRVYRYLCDLNNVDIKNLKLKNIIADRIETIIHMTGKAQIDIENLSVREITGQKFICDDLSQITINGQNVQ